MEALKVPVEKEAEKGDEIELSLDLSIGGRYAKSGSNSRGKTGDRFSAQNKISGASRSDFGCGGGDVGAEKGWDQSTDPQRRKEIQALRRQEARKNREAKLKKSRGANGVGSVEDKASLEAQKFQVRVQDREVRERDDFPEELGRRRAAANGNNGFAHPRVAPSCGSCGAYGKRHSSQDCDSERSKGINGGGDGKSLSNGSLERSSSAASDYHSTSGKGGNSSDTGSHSSPSHLPQHNRVPATAAPRQLQAGNVSSSQTEHSSKVVASTVPHPSWTKFTDQSKPDTASAPKSPPSKETCSSLVPKPPNLNHVAASSFPHMPCVSTTGNGPNSKTITGFLYRYTNNEVSIMCACHGSSFSPAEFVEHAGGVNVSNPLMHITVVASSLGCS